MARSSSWGELTYRPLAAPWGPSLEIFRFAGAWSPPIEQIDSGWGVWDGERFSGALVAERSGPTAMLHGPVVVGPPDAAPVSVIEVAAELLAAALRHAEASAIDTVFTRPHGLDGIWVRHGFIPVPEVELPKALRGRPGVGLFGWRGGSALWSAARRGTPPRRSARSA
ncbi:MAG TPA: hypothetical protein VEL75_00305 [Candidatus Methylomirabilis sp.]|nr:hypothetical protein [Candidatus Methylomirabilis sp.]